MAYNKKNNAIECTRVIKDSIAKGEKKKAYLLYGEERYLVKQNYNNLLNYLNPQKDTMNVNWFSADGLNVKEVIDIAETLPFFADYRIIILEQSGLFSSEGEELANYLKEAPDTTIFIFVEHSADGRCKLLKSIKEVGLAVNYVRQSPQTLEAWIKSRARQAGKTMPGGVVAYFIQRVGDDMQLLEMELEKLLAYVWDKSEISAQDVNEICTTTIEDRIFEMIESLSKMDQKQTLANYHDLLAKKEPPAKILTLINREYWNLLTMKQLFEKGRSKEQVATAMGVNEYVVSKRMPILGKYSRKQLENCFEKGVQADHSFKSGKISDLMAVELLLLSVVGDSH